MIPELPPEADKRLMALWKKIRDTRAGGAGQPLSPLDQLRYLLVRLAENWARFRVFDWQADVPWTNNRTEQAIGRMRDAGEDGARIQNLVRYAERIIPGWNRQLLKVEKINLGVCLYLFFIFPPNLLWDKHKMN